MTLKFNLKRIQIEIEPDPNNEGYFRVVDFNEMIPGAQVMNIEYLKQHFTPASCGAMDLFDP